MKGAVAIRNLLLASSDVTDILGTGENMRVYPSKAPKGADNPCVTLYFDNNGLRSKSALVAHDTSCILNIFTDENKYDQALDLSQKIKDALDKQSSSVIKDIQYNGCETSYDHESESHQITQKYRLWQNESL